MRVIGVDPGKAGAIAELMNGLDSMPTILAPLPLVKSAKGRDEYDLPGLRALLAFRQSLARDGNIHVIIERQQAMPSSIGAGGAMTNFSVGYILGALEALCVGLQLPYTLVTPRRWQADMLDGIPGDDTKQRAVQAALRLFPGVDLKRTERSHKHDSGKADALMIAAWGQRKLAALERVSADVSAALEGSGFRRVIEGGNS